MSRRRPGRGAGQARREVTQRAGGRQPTGPEPKGEANMFHDFVMPWGKHRGRPVNSLPSPYLTWLREHRFCGDLRLAAAIELDRRGGWPVRRTCPLCGGAVARANHAQGPPP